MELTTFSEIGIIVAIATAASIAMHFMKQPLIIAYLTTGALAGPTFFNLVSESGVMATFSEIGVAFLLFLVGLNLNPRILKDVGGIAVFTGGTQVLITSIIGFFVAKLLGFQTLPSIYIGTAIAFSSTIIVIKFLSDKRHLETLYGRLATGHLLMQDIIAIFLLLAVSSFSTGASLGSFAISFVGKLIFGLGLVALVSRFAFPRILPRIAKSQELLFVFSIGWLFVVTALFQSFDISIEIGALIAGISFSMFPYHYGIAARVRPLRDFFIILFFIFLGAQMDFAYIGPYIFPAIFMSLVVTAANPLIVTGLLGFAGLKRKVSFLAGLSMTQISEFSLILISIGIKLGHISNEILSFVTLVALFTIASSTYFNLHSEKIFSKLNHALKIFERRKNAENMEDPGEMKYDVVLFGFNRVGFNLFKAFRKMKKRALAVDYNPLIIRTLEKENIPCTYGDASDIELLKEISWEDAGMAVSNISDPETNLILINFIKEQNPNCIIVAVTHTVANAIRLYEGGAAYVILPHMLSAKKTLNMVKRFGFNFECFVQEKMQHLEHLKKFRYEF